MVRKVKKRRALIRKALRVKKVKLAPTEVLEIALPKNTEPGLVVDKEKNIMEVVPVPTAKRGFWRSLFRD